MELEKNPSKYGENYVEAETISNDDSEKSSLLEFHDLNLEENHCTEGVLKLKNLIEDLEASFRVSNAIDNSLLLKCILLEAENDNLKRIAREKNVKVNLCRSPVSLSSKSDYNKTNRLWKNKEGTNVQREIHGERGKAANSNLSKMQETIHKLEGELKDREKTVALLCEKYLYLKSNKNRMEIDLKRKLCGQERLLKVTYGVLQDLQVEVEAKIESRLSKSKNMYETLFLQEKWRCKKLMNENVRLLYELNRLENSREKNQNPFVQNREKFCGVMSHTVNKCTSQPAMGFC